MFLSGLFWVSFVGRKVVVGWFRALQVWFGAEERTNVHAQAGAFISGQSECDLQCIAKVQHSRPSLTPYHDSAQKTHRWVGPRAVCSDYVKDLRI